MTNRESWKTVKANCKWVIYILRCPDTNQVRYVGWTGDAVNRMAVHRYRAKYICKTDCEIWVRGLLKDGKEPIKEVVQYGEGPWEKSEQAWIRHFRAMGVPLTNLTDGGGGCIGYHPKESTLELMRNQPKRKWTQEERDAHSKRFKGRIFTTEWKEKIRQAKLRVNPARGKPHTEEQKRKKPGSVFDDAQSTQGR